MWRVIIMAKIYSLLVSHVDCSLTALGEPIGFLGPTIVEQPNRKDDDLKLVTDAINAQKLSPDLVNLIASRTADQRAAIDAAYLKATGKSISTAVNSFLSEKGHSGSRYLFYGFFLTLPYYLAFEIRGSLDRGGSTKDWTYMSIICTSSATKLKAISDAYMAVNGVSLNDDINMVGKAGRPVYQKMVDPKTMRPDNGTDKTKVDEQFALLPTEKTSGSCHDVALEDFLTSASFAQIKLVVEKYNGVPDSSGKPLADEMKKKCKKGLMQEIYKRIVRYAAAPYEYLAEEFYLGMNADIHNKNAHRYQLIARSEIDLQDIILRYCMLFDHNPEEDMESWTKNEYRDLFHAVLKGNRPKE
uniref:Annexin-like protein 4 n=1 Tax=Nilaparvata lugens TaxID=108931 RepID=A0A191UR60_NILLU|nr:annexin-like protein 4 [Nilaparvata lugens]